MRLSQLCRNYILGSLVCVLILGGMIHYFIFRNTLHHTADESLNEYRRILLRELIRTDTLPDAKNVGVKPQRLRYDLIGDGAVKDSYRDTLIYHEKTNQFRSFRILSFPVEAGDKRYRASIFLRTMGGHDTLRTILFSYACIFLLFLLFTFLLIHFLSRKIWIPFQSFLRELRNVGVDTRKTFSFAHSEIEEIRELDNVYTLMLKRIQTDFRKTRELSENITHEIQTPLTIMRSRIDSLLQKYEKDEDTLLVLQSLQENINRLSRFNRSLILLSRIQQEYFDEEPISFNEMIREKIEEYQDFIDHKQILLNFEEKGMFTVVLNRSLAEILINNLFSNALRYTNAKGFISIVIADKQLILSNSYEGALPAGDLFLRFKKNKKHPDSNGLGLSIVKEICTRFGLCCTVSSDGFGHSDKKCFIFELSR